EAPQTRLQAPWLIGAPRAAPPTPTATGHQRRRLPCRSPATAGETRLWTLSRRNGNGFEKREGAGIAREGKGEGFLSDKPVPRWDGLQGGGAKQQDRAIGTQQAGRFY